MRVSALAKFIITSLLLSWLIWTVLEVVVAVLVCVMQVCVLVALRPRGISGNRSQRRAYRRMAFYGGTEKQILINVMNSRDPMIDDSDRAWAERLLIRRRWITYIPPRAPRLTVVSSSLPRGP